MSCAPTFRPDRSPNISCWCPGLSLASKDCKSCFEAKQNRPTLGTQSKHQLGTKHSPLPLRQALVLFYTENNKTASLECFYGASSSFCSLQANKNRNINMINWFMPWVVAMDSNYLFRALRRPPMTSKSGWGWFHLYLLVLWSIERPWSGRRRRSR